MDDLNALIAELRGCTRCAADLPLGPNPVFRVARTARIVLLSQAPSSLAHASGLPWVDASGLRLRNWMGLDEAAFLDWSRIAVLPVGFCYPGRLPKGGDLPPTAACAPLWHARLWAHMQDVRLTLLLGAHAQNLVLGPGPVAARVRDHARYLPRHFPLPHPSWRTAAWERRTPWFAAEVLPRLRKEVSRALAMP